MPFTASEMWRAKSMKRAEQTDQLIQLIKELWKLSLFAKFYPQYVISKRTFFYQRQSMQNFILLLLLPPRTQTESLLELVRISGCACEETGMPCVYTRLIALGRVADAIHYFYP